MNKINSTAGPLPFTEPQDIGVVRESMALKVDTIRSFPIRSFADPLAAKYPGDEFDYTVSDGDAQNLVQRFLSWFFQFLQDSFGIDLPPGTTAFMEYLIYVLMAILTIYLIIKFFVGENLAAIFTGKAVATAPIYMGEEQLENTDLDGLIAAAMDQKDYRLAIRYQYLKALKALSRQGIIEWHYEKTNRDYQREIKVPALQVPFGDISYLYDYIWYGEQPIDGSIYSAAVQKFEAMHKKIFQP